jgi:hypothetical protein
MLNYINVPTNITVNRYFSKIMHRSTNLTFYKILIKYAVQRGSKTWTLDEEIIEEQKWQK